MRKRLIIRKKFRQNTWKVLNVIVGLTTILNVSSLSLLAAPRMVSAADTKIVAEDTTPAPVDNPVAVDPVVGPATVVVPALVTPIDTTAVVNSAISAAVDPITADQGVSPTAAAPEALSSLTAVPIQPVSVAAVPPSITGHIYWTNFWQHTVNDLTVTAGIAGSSSVVDTLPGSDGIIFNPLDLNKLLVAGQLSKNIYNVSIPGHSHTTVNTTPIVGNSFHLVQATPSIGLDKILTSGQEHDIPNAVAVVSLTSGAVDNHVITNLARVTGMQSVGNVIYAADGEHDGIGGRLYTLNLATNLATLVPVTGSSNDIHSLWLDGQSGHLLAAGSRRVEEIDLTGTPHVVQSWDISSSLIPEPATPTGLGYADQLSSDESGHLFVAFNSGEIIYIDLNHPSDAPALFKNVGGGLDDLVVGLNIQKGDLKVKKIVVGGSAHSSDWSMHVKKDGDEVAGSPHDGSTSGTTYHDLRTGSYDVSETDGPSGYTQSFSDNCDGGHIAVIKDQTVTCTVTNTRSTGTVELKKIWSGVPGQTTLNIGTSIGGHEVDKQLTGAAGAAPLTTGPNTVNAGTYYVSETGGLTNYDSSLACTDNGEAVTPGAHNSLTVAAGRAFVCTFTNTRKTGKITGYKFNDLNNNGKWDEGEPGMNGVSIKVSDWTTTTHDDGEDNPGYYEFTIPTGTYDLSEVVPHGCEATTPHDGKYHDIRLTNDGLRKNFGNFCDGTISGHKYERNGQTPVPDWQICLNPIEDVSSTVFSPTHRDPENCVRTDENGFYQFSHVQPGFYNLTEEGRDGWKWLNPDTGSFPIQVESNGNYIRDFINGRTGILTVHKAYDATGQGEYIYNDEAANELGFRWTLDEGSGKNFGTSETLLLGTDHQINEQSPDGYHFTGWYRTSDEAQRSCANPEGTTLPLQIDFQHNTDLTLCNARDQGTITVVKHVVNEFGGTAKPEDFTMHVTHDDEDVSGSPTSGPEKTFTLNPGMYAVDEASHAGYTQQSLSCVNDNQEITRAQQTIDPNNINLHNGERITCTFTNHDVQPKLTVVKHVVGGTATAASFTMNVGGTAVSPASFAGSESGTAVTLNAGAYAITESAVANYVASYSTDCAGTAAVGDAKTCTVTNTYQAPPTKPSPVVGLSITKTNNITDFANPGQTVRYTVTVKNNDTSTDSAKTVTMTDTLPAGFTFTDGGGSTKTFTLGTIDTGKSVAQIYDVVVGSSVTAGAYVNTAKAKGSNASEVSATSTVNVRVPQVLGAVAAPALTITKTVSTKTTTPGQRVTYHVTVKNTGDAEATNVIVEDTLPKGLTFVDTGLTVRAWKLGNIAPGKSMVITYDVQIGDKTTGIKKNVAVVAADGIPAVKAVAPVDIRQPKVLGLATTGVGATDRFAFLFGAVILCLGLGIGRRFRRNNA